MLDSRCLVVEFHFCMFLFKRVLDNFLLSDSAGFFYQFFCLAHRYSCAKVNSNFKANLCKVNLCFDTTSFRSCVKFEKL